MMPRLRYADLARKPMDVLDMTSLTPDEFQQLLPAFEQAFQAHMAQWCLDGTPRSGRRFVIYTNCPLPRPADRLLFILVYLKTNPLQVAHGIMFGMPQGKTNQWIHVLLPVLRSALRRLGDAPARSLAELAKRLGVAQADAAAVIAQAETAAGGATTSATAPPSAADPPLFAMMAPNAASRAPRTRMNRKAVIAARKSTMPSKTSS